MPNPINQGLQDRILRLMATDDDFLAMVAGRLGPEFFLTSMTGRLAQVCLDYHAQFKAAPGDHFADEALRAFAERPEDDRADCLTYLQRLRDLPPPNREYVLRRINDAIKLRVREEAAVQFAEHVARGELDQADQVMYGALRSGLPAEEDALDYLRDLSALATRADRPEYLLHTGIRAMDRVFGGMGRGQLVSVVGGAKAGKTWFLQHLAREALCQGLFVLHVSHEVGLKEMELRYDMVFTGRGKREGKRVVRPRLVDGKPQDREIVVRTVYDDDAVRRGRAAVRRNGGRLMLKKYPMGQCTPAEIERFLNYLEAYCDFIPDVLVNDYVDIMDLSRYSDETRHQLNAAYVWSKGLADDRNILVLTASQLNREGLERRVVRKKHVAEDIRKLANVDTLFAIGRSPEDERLGLGGLNVLVSRGEEQEVGCTFVEAYDIGQFCLDSWLDSEVDEAVEYPPKEDKPHPASRPGRAYSKKAEFEQVDDTKK